MFVLTQGILLQSVSTELTNGMLAVFTDQLDQLYTCTLDQVFSKNKPLGFLLINKKLQENIGFSDKTGSFLNWLHTYTKDYT